ncbi:flippase-like domain-containing protein, partial [bacterium]|nr:flippase-like domain-containing protein [bacterium]
MKKNILIVVKLAISAGLLFYLFSIVDVPAMGKALSNATIPYIVLTLLIMVLSVVLSCYKWQALLKIDQIKSSLAELIHYYLIGIYFNNFLPTSIGGDAVRVYMLSKRKGYTAAALTSVYVERVSGLVALILFG